MSSEGSSGGAGGGEGSLSATMKGRVKLFSLERGYGFIKPDNGGADVYVTRLHVEKPRGLLRMGDYVSFQIKKQKGQPLAVSVKRLKEDGTEDDSCAWMADASGAGGRAGGAGRGGRVRWAHGGGQPKEPARESPRCHTHPPRAGAALRLAAPPTRQPNMYRPRWCA